MMMYSPASKGGADAGNDLYSCVIYRNKIVQNIVVSEQDVRVE